MPKFKLNAFLHTRYTLLTSREENQVIFSKEPQFKVSLLFSSCNHSHPSDPQPNALTVIKKAVYTSKIILKRLTLTRDLQKKQGGLAVFIKQ